MSETTYQVSIYDTETKDTVSYHEEFDMSPEGLDFIWREGNYSCDCNRMIFFSKHEVLDYPCGDTGRFKVTIHDHNNNKIYDDEVVDE